MSFLSRHRFQIVLVLLVLANLVVYAPKKKTASVSPPNPPFFAPGLTPDRFSHPPDEKMKARRTRHNTSDILSG
jgi:hypothetical protein